MKNETLATIIKENNLSLKNIKMFNGHDGVGLSCDLYINNKKVAYCFDDARGGEMEIKPLTFAHQTIIYTLNKKLPTYPKYKIDCIPDKEFEHELENVINHMVEVIEEEKELKKLSKKSIVYKTPEGETRLGSWKNVALAMIIAKKGDVGRLMICEACKEIENKGNTILNKYYLKQLGLDI